MKHTRFDKKLISEEELEFLQQHISQKLVDRESRVTFNQNGIHKQHIYNRIYVNS